MKNAVIVKVKGLIDIEADNVIGIIISTGKEQYQSFANPSDFYIGEKCIFIPNGFIYKNTIITQRQANGFKSEGLLIRVADSIKLGNVGDIYDLNLIPIDITNKIIIQFNTDNELICCLGIDSYIIPLNDKSSKFVYRELGIIKYVTPSGYKYKLIQYNNTDIKDITSNIIEYISKIDFEVFEVIGVLTSEDKRYFNITYPNKTFKKHFFIN